MRLSVIVLTSPGREPNLYACLSSINGQTRPPDELIVIDDGSDGGRRVAATTGMILDYRWRPHDGNRSRSRNLGAAAASGEGLVFLDGDMILSPHTLAYYRLYLEQLPTVAVYGYHGNLADDSKMVPSAWVPGLKVQAGDERFPWFRHGPRDINRSGELRVHPHLFDRPQDFAFSASFALRAERYAAVGGFDAERFTCWGFEDLDFAHRLVNAGTPIYFSLDAWCEASPHPRAWRSEADKGRNLPLITALLQKPQPPQILHDREHSLLETCWREVYELKRD